MSNKKNSIKSNKENVSNLSDSIQYNQQIKRDLNGYNISKELIDDQNIYNLLYQFNGPTKRYISDLATDMVRYGIEIESIDKRIDSQIIEKINQELEEEFYPKIQTFLASALLYGGGIVYIDILNKNKQSLINNPNTPLEIKSITKDNYNGLIFFNKNEIAKVFTSEEDPINIQGYEIRSDKYTDFNSLSSKKKISNRLKDITIHITRTVKITDLMSENFFKGQTDFKHLFGPSEILSVAQELFWLESIFKLGLNTIQNASIRVVSREESINSNTQKIESDLKNLIAMQNNFGLLLLGKDDVFSQYQGDISNYDKFINTLSSYISGNLGVPMTKFFGQSPGGLNSTGDSDKQLYQDTILKKQSQYLKPLLIKIINIILAKTHNIYDAKFSFKFNKLYPSLDEKTENESIKVKSQKLTETISSIIKCYEIGLLSKEIALKELSKLSTEYNIFTEITDSYIEKVKFDDELLLGPQEGMNV